MHSTQAAPNNSSNWSSAFSETNGSIIHYTRTGGNKPLVVLLHGLLMNGLCWTELAKALATKYDVIMPDARGHGQSSVPDSGYRYEDHANDVVNLIKVLQLPAPFLLGHSMGGPTAAVVAAHNPLLLRGLILADPTFLSPTVQREVWESDVTEQHRKMLTLSVNEVIADAQARHPSRSPQTLELLAQARLQTSLQAFEVLTPPNPDYKQLVGAFSVPSLLVFGDKGIVTPEVATELGSRNLMLQCQQLFEAGHALHFDQPEQFARLVSSFLHSILH